MREIKNQLQILQDKLYQKKKYNHAIFSMHCDLETQAPKNSVNTTSEAIGFFSEKVYEITNSNELNTGLEYLNKNLIKLDDINKKIIYLITKKINLVKYLKMNMLHTVSCYHKLRISGQKLAKIMTLKSLHHI